MSTLEQEESLLFDLDLARKYSAARDGAPAHAWETAATALNVRSMTHLAADLASRGLKAHPNSDILLHEYILAVALYPEKLEQCFKDIQKQGNGLPNRETLLALVDYYLERDRDGMRRLESVDDPSQKAFYHELWGHYNLAGHRYKDAVASYRRARQFASKDPRLMYHLGESYRALGKREQALRWLFKAVRRERHYVQAWNALCGLYLEAGERDLAQQSLGMALSVNPRDWAVYFTLADFHLAKGEYRRAKSVLEGVLELKPRPVMSAEVCNYLGYIHFIEGEHAEAGRYFNKALELNPFLAVAWLNLGNLYFHLKRHEEAIRCYEEALKADSQIGAAATQIGLSYLSMGRVGDARAPLEKALDLDPSEYFAHLGLSEFYRRTRNPIASLEQARQALLIEPEDANVHNYLGIALETNRKYFEAEKAYKKALELDPDHRWAANNLGYLYEKLMRLDRPHRHPPEMAFDRRGVRGGLTRW
ncbi:MAG: tetratricopeptide repeat protein [Acidobacteriota bacterium]